MIFKGVCTALVTPFKKDNLKSVDYKSLKKLIEFQLSAKVDAILILGTTGESANIDLKEREKIIAFSKKIIQNKCKLIVGTGTNSTKKTIELTNNAKKLGADACLITTPYYNKCTQEGAYLHYKTITESVDIPIIVYNVPSRTGFNLEIPTYKKIITLKNIQGIKEANTNIEHILDLFYTLKDFPIYCGNDNLNYLFYCLNSKGVISVLSNAYPKEVKDSFCSIEKSFYYNNLFFNMNKLLFIETNPIPIKYLLNRMKIIKNSLRLPLTTLSDKYKRQIEKEFFKIKEC